MKRILSFTAIIAIVLLSVFTLTSCGISFQDKIEIKTSGQTKYNIAFNKKNSSTHDGTLYAEADGKATVNIICEEGTVSVVLEKKKDGEKYASKENIISNSSFDVEIQKGSLYVTVKSTNFKGEVTVQISTSNDETTYSYNASEDMESFDSEDNSLILDIIDEDLETEAVGEQSLLFRVQYSGSNSEKYSFEVSEKAEAYIEENSSWFENLEADVSEKKDSLNTNISYANLVANSERYGNQLISVVKAKIISIEEITFEGKGIITLLEVTDKKGKGDSYIIYLDQEVSDIVEGDIIQLYGIPLGDGVVFDDPNQGKIDAIAILGCYYKKNTGLFS